jgi:hypothetical protein
LTANLLVYFGTFVVVKVVRQEKKDFKWLEDLSGFALPLAAAVSAFAAVCFYLQVPIL